MSKATNDKETGEGNNKIKILGVIIVVAMIVLSSSGVAGYEDDEKNESGEELPDLTISNLIAYSYQGGFSFGLGNYQSSYHRCLFCNIVPKIETGTKDVFFRMHGDGIYAEIEVSNTGNENVSNASIGFYVDGNHMEDTNLYVHGRDDKREFIRPLKEKEGIYILHKSKKEISARGIPYMTRGSPHNVTIKIDPDNQIKESNENNNEVSVVIVNEDWSIWGVDLIIIIIILLIIIIFKIKQKINEKNNENENKNIIGDFSHRMYVDNCRSDCKRKHKNR